MNIAFVVFDYFPYGGLQRDMLAIAKVCRERQHRVTVLARSWQGEIPEGETVELLPIAAASNHARDAAFAKMAATKFQQYDLVVGFNKMPGIDVYYAADGCLAERYQGWKTLLPRYRSKLAMERSVFQAPSMTRVLSIAPPQKALYQQHYGTAEARFVDLPPGIRRDRTLPDDFATRRESLRRQCNIAEQTTMLLFVGSGFRTKGLDRAIRLLAGLEKTVQLFVVGEDKQGPFARLARKLGVSERVHFMGGRDDVQDWLWSADLLVHLAYAENTGTVLLEAAIAGLPVLTTSVCGYAPYITAANMGAVVAIGSATEAVESAALDATFIAQATTLLSQPRNEWRDRSVAFARDADIYSLTEHAVDGIEETARTKGVL
jgi:UDP-glucose:(heptosyl)LPS alpha-1,3-glucosyltransferase